MSLQSFEIHGIGQNLRPDDNAIIVEIGGSEPALLQAMVQVKVASKVKNVKITAEFHGVCETRWGYGGRLATKQESSDYKVYRHGNSFQRVMEVVYDSKEPLLPENGRYSFPVSFKISNPNTPPSFGSTGGSIQYSIKCTMLFQEGMNLLKSTYELDVPVVVSLAEPAVLQLIKSPTPVSVLMENNLDKAGYSIDIPTTNIAIGDALEANISITSTPGKTRLRLVNAALKLVASYMDQDRVVANAKFPRPLDDVSQLFPLSRIGGVEGDPPIVRRLHLLVDPTLAISSFESPLISVKTVFRLEIILDNSEIPNVVHEVPITVVPAVEAKENPRTSRKGAPSVASLMSNTHSIPGSYRSTNSIQTLNISVLESDAASFYGIRYTDAPIAKDGAAQRPVSLSLSGSQRHYLDLTSPRTVESALEGITVSNESIGERSLEDSMAAYNLIYPTHPSTWSIEMVCNWLTQFGASEDIIETFSEQQVDGGVLMTLTSEDLKKELGVSVLGVRRKICLAIEQMRKMGH